jgi:CRISPR/Cas system-associated protein endoribonuclease Cas2
MEVQAGGLAQVVECLPSKRKALNLTPSNTKEKKKAQLKIKQHNIDTKGQIINDCLYMRFLEESNSQRKLSGNCQRLG